MKTKISLLTGLTAGLLFAAALPSAALPGPDDYKKTTDEVKKATALPQAPAPEDVNKALEAAKAAGNPTPKSVFPGPADYQKTADDVKKAGASTKAGPLPQAPAPEDVNKAVEAAKGNPAQGESKASTSGAQSSSLPYTFYDRFTHGSQKPTSDTEDWHKKNEKNKQHHHGDDQGQFDNVLIGDYSQAPSQSHSASDRADQKHRAHKTANDTYDGSPIHYNKPKPTSDTEDWHKKNKNEHHHHDGYGREDNAKQDWQYLNLNNPKDGTATHSQVPPTSDRAGQKASWDQHEKHKNKHHHHGDDQN